MNRATQNFEENLQGFFNQVFDAWNIIAQVIGFIVILGMQLWWASIVFFRNLYTVGYYII